MGWQIRDQCRLGSCKNGRNRTLAETGGHGGGQRHLIGALRLAARLCGCRCSRLYRRPTRASSTRSLFDVFVSGGNLVISDLAGSPRAPVAWCPRRPPSIAGRDCSHIAGVAQATAMATTRRRANPPRTGRSASITTQRRTGQRQPHKRLEQAKTSHRRPRQRLMASEMGQDTVDYSSSRRASLVDLGRRHSQRARAPDTLATIKNVNRLVHSRQSATGDDIRANPPFRRRRRRPYRCGRGNEDLQGRKREKHPDSRT